MQNNIPVRQLRTKLAEFLNGNQAVVIGDPWHNRAILVPLTSHYNYNRAKQRQAIAHAGKEMLRILALLRQENRA